jgi:uncharacterized protein YrzB (UPF0473 family)
LRENLSGDFCAKKHLDEPGKTRYTISRPSGVQPAASTAFCDEAIQERIMSDEIKNPNTEEEEYQPDLMTLEDEDGNEVTFEVIDALDHKGVHYLAVVEYAENEEDLNEDAQLVILSVGEDDEGEYLDVVEDDEVLMEVSKLFEQRLSEDYDIE